MKTIDKTSAVRDEVIAEVHRHKEAIAAEHNFDIDALLGGLRERQSLNPRLVSRIPKGEQAGGGQPVTRPESK
jgi:hypothetical protein